MTVDQNLPEIVIAGAPKCGTTAIWNTLSLHPRFAASTSKEFRFFSRATGALDTSDPEAWEGPLRSGRHHLGMEWFARQFDTGPEGTRLRCDASTAYFATPESPELIRAANPDARVVLVLRDPVDRMHSHWIQELRAGLRIDDFGDCVHRGAGRAVHWADTSSYARHLPRWSEVFGDALLVATLDTLRASPEGTTRRILEHVGLDPGAVDLTAARREANERVEPRLPALERTANLLAARLPDGPAGGATARIRRLLGRARRALRPMTQGASRRESRPDPRLRAELVVRFAVDVECVEDAVGEKLSAWRR
jgi:hypothetical protein